MVYNGSNFKDRATKYVHLRSIQYNLDRIICDHIIDNLDPGQSFDFLTHLPHTTELLIDYLSSTGLLARLSPPEITALKRAYNLSLMYLHVCHNLYSANDIPVRLRLEASKVVDLERAFVETYQNSW